MRDGGIEGISGGPTQRLETGLGAALHSNEPRRITT